jgi:hypothetical protein
MSATHERIVWEFRAGKQPRRLGRLRLWWDDHRVSIETYLALVFMLLCATGFIIVMIEWARW